MVMVGFHPKDTDFISLADGHIMCIWAELCVYVHMYTPQLSLLMRFVAAFGVYVICFLCSEGLRL